MSGAEPGRTRPLARGAGAGPPDGVDTRLAAYARLARARPASRPIGAADLLEELERVHALEQAALLAEAVDLGLRWGRGRSLRTHVERSARALPDWRARLDEELACARADALPALPELAASRRPAPRRWSALRTLHLARSARGLVDRASARLAFACACARAGDAATALAELDALERGLAHSRGRRPFADVGAGELARVGARCRASALEQSGDLAGALRCLEGRGGGTYDAVVRFALALAVDDEPRARSARAQLDVRTAARRARVRVRAVRAALVDLGECLPRWCGRSVAHGACAGLVFELFCERAGAAGEVALAWARAGASHVPRSAGEAPR